MLIDDIPTPAAHWWNPIFFGLHLSFTLPVPLLRGILFECSRFHHNPSECIRGEIPFVIKGEREEQKHTHKPHYHVTENQNPSPHGAKTSTNQIYRQPSTARSLVAQRDSVLRVGAVVRILPSRESRVANCSLSLSPPFQNKKQKRNKAGSQITHNFPPNRPKIPHETRVCVMNELRYFVCATILYYTRGFPRGRHDSGRRFWQVLFPLLHFAVSHR